MGLKGLNRDLSRMLAPWTMVAMMFALNACQSGISHRDTDSLSSSTTPATTAGSLSRTQHVSSESAGLLPMDAPTGPSESPTLPVVPPVVPPIEPMDQRLPEPIGKFKNTYYYLVSEHKYDDRDEPKDTPMFAEDGSVLVYVKKSFYKAVKIEGSGKLNDGRVINFSSYRDQTYHWAFTKHLVGRGVGNCALVPYKTIAVDPDVIPLGSLVYIDETKGMKLPDGSLHNGYWRADDKGGAIQEKRIDIFVGVDEESGQLLADNGIKHMQALTVRLIQKPEADSCANQDPQ